MNMIDADLSTADKDGPTPLSLLVERRRQEMLKSFLQDNDIKPTFSLVDTHWAPEFATLLSSETWEHIRKHMPGELR